MSTLTLPPASPKSLKRRFSDAELDSHFKNSIMEPAVAGPQQHLEAAPGPRQHSPPPLTPNVTTTTDPGTPNSQTTPMVNAANPQAMAASDALNPPKKRTKLTDSEKEAKRLEKEIKERDKAQQKAKKEEDKRRKEEERAKKDEEKRAKDAEKEKKRLEKEEQVKLKEAEKKRKEEEKDKKSKSQLRLNAFFAASSLSNNESAPSSCHGSPSPAMSRRGSVSSIHGNDALARERSLSATPSKPKLSIYERHFPSFFLQSHTSVAPHNRFGRDAEGLHFAQRSLDDKMAEARNTDLRTTFNLTETLHLSPYKRRKLNGPPPSVKAIVDCLHGTSHNPIDLTDSQKLIVSENQSSLLKTVSTRTLKFAEDVRPPYVGTYSRLQNPVAARKICRNPFFRGLPTTDYDYDSEAEWEEPGEGEDLESEGEEEIESEDGDDMEGFLDDEDTTDGAKRRLVTGNLEPTSTGLCWESAAGLQALPELSQYRIEVILENPKIPIDPYSTAYWQETSSASALSSRTTQSVMDPPRVPLNPLNRTNHLLPPQSATSCDSVKAQPFKAGLPSKAPKMSNRMVAPDILEDFKRAVEGSDLTKAGLVEILKKQFPKQSKDAIKDTLAIVAERVGSKEKDKRWVLKTDPL
ncbi:MAG: hypothetical protein Q9181_005683 [Wetmoreana brouardii]